MKKYKKKYLALLDIVITEIVSQKLQVSLIKDYITKNNGDLVFYSTENHSTFQNLNILRHKIKEKIKVDGIIFYSLLQFCYSKRNNIHLMEQILDKKIELTFIRENITLKNKLQLKNKIIEIKYFPKTHNSLIYNLKKNFLKTLKK